MTKKLTLLFFICILGALNINAEVYEGSCGANVSYSLDTSTGVLNITGTGAMKDYSYDSSVPWYIYRSYIKTVEIAEGVTTIGSRVFFSCSGLTSIIIPNSVTEIGFYAFYSCSGLTSITIPNSVTSLVNGAFTGCSGLTSIEIPNSVTSIGEQAFSDCSNLTSVTIPNSVTTIGRQTFMGCSNLTSVTIPNSVTEIGGYAFRNCISLTSITIPNSVTSIGEYAFRGCSGLTSVTIPNSVTSIGERAFYNCSGLTSVTIGNSVTSIGEQAFTGCSKLTDVYCYAEKVPSTGINVFYNANIANATLYVPVTSLDAYMSEDPWSKFSVIYCAGLCGENASFTLNQITGVLKITGTGAMKDYSYDSSVPWYIYRSYIKTVEIAEGVTAIGEVAFCGCSELASITIPNSITKIGMKAFSDCSSLISVNISDIAAWCNVVFSDINSNPLTKAKHLYMNGKEITDLIIPESVTSIVDGAFMGCSGLTSVTIPNSVTSIGYGAFQSCSGLTSVTIPNSVTSIGSYAFYKCSNLTSITIPNSVTSIGNFAFYYCSGMTKVTLNSNAIASKSYISSSTLGSIFGNQVNEYVLGDDVTSIGSYAFYNCSDVTSVIIPDKVTSVGYYAFYGTSWYNNLPDGLYYIGKVAYKYKGTMPENTSIIIKEGTVELNDGVFDGCTGLTSLYIPSSVKSIENNAFANCTELLDVYCYARKSPIMGKNVFANSGIQFATLYVPEISVDGYKATEPWSGFGNIQALSGENPETPKCSTPTISYVDGKLLFSCETEGAEIHYEYGSKGVGSDASIKKITVTVYAKKDGFENSDVATKEIDLGTSGIRGDLNGDGVVNMPDAMFIVNKILNGKFPDEEDNGSKPGVRFGFYETIPGYSVKIDKVNMDGVSPYVMGSNAVGTILSRTSSQPTWDNANGSYSFVDLAYSNDMFVRIDYTLTADDGSGEKIVVKDAVATIPTQYIQWKSDYKYTYIIKIYDNTNTFNWGETPVSEIYPATFDAIVIEDDNGQSTVTNITTR